MRLLDKSTAYAKLLDIKQEHQIDVSKYIKEMAGNKTIPYEVVVFINKYSPLPHLEIYNRIYEKRTKNPLYKTLVNENSSTEERAIALSSLLTQIMISSKSLTNEDRMLYHNIIDTSSIIKALESYTNGDSSKLDETFLAIRSIFKNLYKKED